MRSLGVLLSSLALSLGCGGTTNEPAASGEAGQSSSGGASPGGAPASGSSAGGSSDPVAEGSGAGSAGTPSGGASGGESSTEGGQGGGEALVDCDVKKVTCKRAAPACGTFEVPRVEGTCYGECVKIDRCACSGPEQCPDPNQFTCWSKTHCGPYVR